MRIWRRITIAGAGTTRSSGGYCRGWSSSGSLRPNPLAPDSAPPEKSFFRADSLRSCARATSLFREKLDGFAKRPLVPLSVKQRRLLAGFSPIQKRRGLKLLAFALRLCDLIPAPNVSAKKPRAAMRQPSSLRRVLERDCGCSRVLLHDHEEYPATQSYMDTPERAF